MNPWITQDLGTAHRSELERVATRRMVPTTARRGDRQATVRPLPNSNHRSNRLPGQVALVGRALVAVGSPLVRAGNRLSGGPGVLPG